MVLVAAAGTSKLRRRTEHDNKAFKKFMEEEGIGHCPVYVDGAKHSMAEFLYKFIRNNLIHEANLHSKVAFVPSMNVNEASIVSLCSHFPGKAIIEHSMVLVIGSQVAFARENSDLPDEMRSTFWAPR